MCQKEVKCTAFKKKKYRKNTVTYDYMTIKLKNIKKK